MRWNLTAKITLFASVFLLLSLVAVGATLWTAWNLQGGAAAVNEAGRLRMLSYRLALSAATQPRASLAADARQLQDSLELLRRGDAARPLFVPWDATIRARYARVQAAWAGLRPRWLDARAAQPSRAQVDAFVASIDSLVMSIERRLDFWNTMLHTAQLALAGLVLLGTMLMFVAGFLLVLDPVGRLSRGVTALARGDYAARVDVVTTDELGELAQAFNRMAGQLQGVHEKLEERVRAKTADLRTEQQRLAALYEVSALVSHAQDLPTLARDFVRALQRIAGADAAVLRWTDETARRYLLLAAEGMPEALRDDERCLLPGACHCGSASVEGGTQVVHFTRDASSPEQAACVRAGFNTLLSVPVAAQQRLLGEVDLLYRDASRADPAQHALYEALAGHLAAAMESLRGAALEREAVVARERTLLARELHDSIAQALAYMKIQLQLLRGAMQAGDVARTTKALDDIEHGVRDSLADVRELLLHFRTRTRDQDIEPALRMTLHKFELQAGVEVRADIEADGGPLAADVQIQVLHIVQEALSNVRKHAHARCVDVAVRSVPRWSFELRDDGVGFDPDAPRADQHVGLQIMRERAATIGAALLVASRPGQGTRVRLELASTEMPRAAAELESDHE
ncbi:nitrate/nitrite sensor protein NarX [mine drainage metagenome]|uniref:histidine kinase n=1 Tax=mine drainage metagenome TaxID=410659 RepID=A0A1J5QW01_9ZZZZ